MLYVAIFSIPFFAGLLPAIFFRARDVSVVGGVALGSLILGAMASGHAGAAASMMMVALVGIPLVALSFGMGVAIGHLVRIRTEGHRSKRLQIAAVALVVLAIGVGPIAYTAWRQASEVRERQAAAIAFVATRSDVVTLVGAIQKQVVVETHENELASPPTRGYTILVTGERGEAFVTVTQRGDRDTGKLDLERIVARKR